MPSRIALFCGTLLLAAVSAGGAVYVSFDRVIPAARDLGGDDVVVVYTLVPDDAGSSFLETFVDRANRAGTLRVDAATDRQMRSGHPDAAGMRRLRRLYPRDVYLGVESVRCTTSAHDGIGSEKNPDGQRIKVRQHWIDALCHATVAVLDPESGRRVSSFDAKGEGTSPRVLAAGDEEGAIAIRQAAHFAGVSAAEMITPRRTRESIELDPGVPEFDRAMALVDADRLPQAREILLDALHRHGESPALHLDIAAISEAIGDLEAAHDHYTAAEHLAPPADRRYKRERLLFQRRNVTRPAAQRRP